ncbi:MAG: helix-turn-helix transcriptional regulator [Actinomycetota bacterium]|nr:helix-turn-helix transcriptional regulator [Actinomycetota bacterium]
MTDVLAYVARRIRQLRTTYGETGLSQEALAKQLGIAANTVSRWETGAYKPDLADLEKLSRFFKQSILTFFPQDADPVKKETEALLRAAEALPADDVEELIRFAEFRRAKNIHKTIGKTKSE